jgi:hypothetical protein
MPWWHLDVWRPARAGVERYGPTMNSEELQRIRDLIDELRQMRAGSSGDLYRHYSGPISSLRHILRRLGKDSAPG